MILNNLSPRREEAGTIIINELDEFGEVTFVCQGKVGLGYEINKVKKFCIVYQDYCIIGAYGATFSQRAAFCYSALSEISGYFIRKRYWATMIEEFPEVSIVLKKNILMNYFSNIKFKLASRKKKDIMKYMQRKDY